MAELKGSKTEANLRYAFAREAEANRRYLWFAEQADVDGHPQVAELFRQLAESETGHAFGHLEILAELGDPATGEPLEETEDHLRAAITAELSDAEEMYPGFAATAESEGFGEVAAWMESLARAEQQQAERLRASLATITGTGTDEEDRTDAGGDRTDDGPG